MSNRIRAYHRPKDVDEALELWRRDSTLRPLIMRPKPAVTPETKAEVVDLSLLGFSFIRQDAQGILIGSMTPVQELVESPVIRSVADGILSEAAQLASHLGLRNLATMEGLTQAPDGAPEVRLVLQVLQCEFIPMAADNLAYGVRIPLRSNVHGALARVARAPRDEAMVAACAVVEVTDGACQDARLAVSCPRPAGVLAVEGILRGHAFTPELLQTASKAVINEVKPESDFRASEEYRREMAGLLARRALETAWKRATAV